MYSSDVQGVDALAQAYRDLRSEISKVIVGQNEVVKTVLMTLFSNGHSLLVGVRSGQDESVRIYRHIQERTSKIIQIFYYLQSEFK